jgi:hypothetical protein
MAALNGGCLCGSVRYSTAAKPVMSGICHCRDCQKFTGSAFGALVAVPKSELTIEGSVKTFASLGSSGKTIFRHFCPECGSSLAEEVEMRPELIILNIGTLDDPKAATPQRETFCDDALPWVHVTPDVPRFPKRAG